MSRRKAADAQLTDGHPADLPRASAEARAGGIAAAVMRARTAGGGRDPERHVNTPFSEKREGKGGTMRPRGHF